MMGERERHLTEAQLHDAADATAAPMERAAIEQHLAECATCRSEVDRIRALLGTVFGLPRGIAPPPGLWSGIAERIRRPESFDVARAGVRTRRAYAWLAAAAILLVVASSAITARVLGRPGATVASRSDSTPASDDSGARTPGFRTVRDEYERMDRDLAALLEAQREKLAPETVAKVERNLDIIDRAIGEIREALAEDPGNKALQQLLKASYGHKAALLRQVSQS